MSVKLENAKRLVDERAGSVAPALRPLLLKLLEALEEDLKALLKEERAPSTRGRKKKEE